MQTANQLYKKMGEGEILQVYDGAISSKDVSNLLSEAEKKIKSFVTEKTKSKRVYSLYIECLQNLFHHISKDPKTGKNNGVILLTFSKDAFSIATSNYIDNEETEDLCNRIDTLNSLSSDDLKKLYLDRLSNSGFSKKGGGGLGLIDMVRKSKNKLEYSIEKLDSRISSINLKVKI